MTTDEQLKMIKDYKNGIVIQMKDEDDNWVDLEEDHQFDFVHNEYRYKEELPWQEEPDVDKAIAKWHKVTFEEEDPTCKLTVGETAAFKAGIEWQLKQEEINADSDDTTDEPVEEPESGDTTGDDTP